jgi:hypothetical protein
VKKKPAKKETKNLRTKGQKTRRNKEANKRKDKERGTQKTYNLEPRSPPPHRPIAAMPRIFGGRERKRGPRLDLT